MSKSCQTLVVASLLFLPAMAGAEGTVCATPTVVVPDGRITTSTIPAGGSYFFRISSRAGNSYSVEFHNVLGAAVQTPGDLSVFSDACTTPIVLGPSLRDTKDIDPADLNGARRSLFSATTSQTYFQLDNTSGSPITYSFTVSDTTMFSASWSTNGTYQTYYSFLNTTGAVIHGTLTLYTRAGVQVATNNFTINPNSTQATNTVALVTPRDTTGTAKFAHDGPPGAILAEAVIANFTIVPTPYVQVVKFVPTRESTH
jgi:hypothetical protein